MASLQPFTLPQSPKGTQVITTDFLAKVDMARLKKAAQGLESGTMQVLIEGRDESAVWGLVRTGEEKAYSVQVANGYASCSCPDWSFRHRHGHEVCKHALALALYAINHPEEYPSEGERKPDLRLTRVRSEAEREQVRLEVRELYGVRRLPPKPYEELP